MRTVTKWGPQLRRLSRPVVGPLCCSSSQRLCCCSPSVGTPFRGDAAAWSVCLLLAFVGWGGVVEWLLGDGVPAGWALRAVWGIAAVLVLGGPLAALHVAFRPVLLAQLIVGLLFAGYFASVRWARTLMRASGTPAPREMFAPLFS